MSADAAPELITIAEWAREEGIDSRVARVRIERHKIPVIGGRVNRAEANRIWQLNHNPRQAARRRKKPVEGAPVPPVEPKPAGQQERKGRPPSLTMNVVSIEGGGKAERSFENIDRARAEIKLMQEQLKYATSAGLVYPAADVDNFVSSMIVSCRETLWHLPGEIQDKLAASMDPVECGKILQRGVEGALKKMGKFTFKPKK